MNERQIFEAALAIADPGQRAAYLAQACAGDETVQSHIQGLIEAHEKLGSFLESASPVFVATVSDAPLSERPGDAIGPYKLLEQIGEGGFGVVFMAEQTAPVKRKVALKVIKPGMDTREVIARFEAERQALALMDHPNIAKVLDAGATESGRPYFVMELVRGVPVTEYCDQAQLTPRQRLELFVTVCQAVQHAHQKGIIHRDIKPTNVLVAQHDDKPVVKVIDFGVAKATSGQLTDKTLFTGFAQVVGTPLYMSPEQAALSAIDIDTRSDIYSLGVLLYELLTGTTPFDKTRLQQAAFEEIRRIIREEEPQKPSTRLSSLGATLPSVSAVRRMEPRKLSQLVRGDLDWIVMKALEKDRARRYDSANGFASDILRYLADEPVEACPPSAAYRFRKFARRNKTGFTVASVVALAILLVVGSLGWMVRDRAARDEQVARDQKQREEEVTREREAREAQIASENAQRRARLEERITEALDESLAEYEQDRLPEAFTALKRAEGLLAGGDAVSDELRQRVEEWRADLSVVDRLEELSFVYERSDCPETDVRYTELFLELGIDVDNIPVAESARLIRSQRIWRSLTEGLDRWAGVRQELIYIPEPPQNARENKIRLLQIARAADADDLRSRARLAVEQWDASAALLLAESPEMSLLPSSILRHLSMVIYWNGGESGPAQATHFLENARLQRPGDYQLNVVCALYYQLMEPPNLVEAADAYARAMAIRPGDSRVQGRLAYVYLQQRDLERAIACYLRDLELDPTDRTSLANLSVAQWNSGRRDDAVATIREAVQLAPDYVFGHNKLAVFLRAQGKLDEALAVLREAVRLNPDNGEFQIILGDYLRVQGDREGALAAYRESVRLSPDNAAAHNNLGVALRELGQADEAIRSFRRALELDPNLFTAHRELALTFNMRGDFVEAISHLDWAVQHEPDQGTWQNELAWLLATCPEPRLREPERAVELAREAVELAPAQGTYWNTLGVAQYRSGEWSGAIESLSKSHEMTGEQILAFDAFFLAMACWQLERRDEADDWYEKAVVWMEEHAPADEELLRFRAEAIRLLGLDTPQSAELAPAAASDPLAENDDHDAVAPLGGNGMLQVQLQQILRGNTAAVMDVAFLEDEDRVTSVTANPDRSLRVWDLDTGEILHTHKHRAFLNRVVPVPGAERVVTAAATGWITMWDLSTDESLFEIEAHKMAENKSPYLNAIIVTPDGRRIVSAAQDHLLVITDAATGDIQKCVDTGSQNYALAITADGQYVLLGQPFGISCWDLKTGERTQHFDLQGLVFSLAFSPDDTLLAAGTTLGQIVLFDVGTWEHVGTLQAHADRVSDLAWMPDGHTLMAGSWDRTLSAWDVTSGQERGRLRQPTRCLNFIAISPSGELLLTGGGNYRRGGSQGRGFTDGDFDLHLWRMPETTPGDDNRRTQALTTPDNGQLTTDN